MPKLFDASLAWLRPCGQGRLRWWCGAVLMLLCALALRPAVAQTRLKQGAPAITDVRFDLGEDGVRMSGNIRFTVSTHLQETLERGVPVYFLFETQTTRSRWYWAGKVVNSNKRYVRLLYQPLTRRWRVNVSSEPIHRGSVGVLLSQNFDSLESALSAVRRISSWQVLTAEQWSADHNYTVRVRLRLDISQLGQTFQGGPAWQSEWGLDVERDFSLNASSLGKTVSQLSSQFAGAWQPGARLGSQWSPADWGLSRGQDSRAEP
ncbi:MAG: DUF4390 domain-containing protein [Brachymonas sp.]|nr:DUF4390 domain-containing protein [Brachymonas sp.]